MRGAPASVASSRPTRNDTANLPSSVLATGFPLKSRTAHCTPGTPRTRVRSVSLRALVCSQYSVFGSMTQTSASVTSRIWLAVRFRMLAKIEVWFSSRNVQNAMAKTRPKYLARSPVSIRSATKFMIRLPGYWYVCIYTHVPQKTHDGYFAERSPSPRASSRRAQSDPWRLFSA